MSDDPWSTALGQQARQIRDETKSIGKTASELARKGATNDEIRELFYPELTAVERRLLDQTMSEARETHGDRLTSEYEDLIDTYRRKTGRPHGKPEPLHPERPTGSAWQTFVRKYREAQGSAVASPTKRAVANAMGWEDEESLTKYLRDNQLPPWRAAKRLAATEPD